MRNQSAHKFVQIKLCISKEVDRTEGAKIINKCTPVQGNEKREREKTFLP